MKTDVSSAIRGIIHEIERGHPVLLDRDMGIIHTSIGEGLIFAMFVPGLATRSKVFLPKCYIDVLDGGLSVEIYHLDRGDGKRRVSAQFNVWPNQWFMLHSDAMVRLQPQSAYVTMAIKYYGDRTTMTPDSLCELKFEQGEDGPIYDPSKTELSHKVKNAIIKSAEKLERVLSLGYDYGER